MSYFHNLVVPVSEAQLNSELGDRRIEQPGKEV